MEIGIKKERVKHAKQCLFWALQEIPDQLRTMNEREWRLRLALDRDTASHDAYRPDQIPGAGNAEKS